MKIQFKISGFLILIISMLNYPVYGSEGSVQKSTLTVKGIHITSWAAGSQKYRKKLEKYLAETEINTVVVAIKEYEGEVYINGLDDCRKYKTYVNAIPDLPQFIKWLKDRNIYTIARIVVFKDNLLALHKPEWAVRRKDGSVWSDRKKIKWTDPYCKEVWDYNIAIAVKAADTGFDEIQFDYIRFPSDGNVKDCKYMVAHSSITADYALIGFLERARQYLQPKKVKISACLFGLTTAVSHDMGIGQKIESMAQYVDYVCPMIYPSHYALGEFGYKNPEKNPYDIVYKSIAFAKTKLKENTTKLRPYLQDFSIHYPYRTNEVKAQIKACYDNEIYTWLLWNASAKYTISAIKVPVIEQKSSNDNIKEKDIKN